MNTIWKVKLDITDRQFVRVPLHSWPLSVQFQNGKLCLWVRCDPELVLYDCSVRIYGTGHKVNEPQENPNGGYVGTVQDGPLVWHVFCG